MLTMRAFAESTLLEMSFMYAASRHHLPGVVPCLNHWCPTLNPIGHLPRIAMEGTHHKIGTVLKILGDIILLTQLPHFSA